MDAKTLALYLGCRVQISSDIPNTETVIKVVDSEVISYAEESNAMKFKLLLRPLSSMTIEHKEQIFDFVWPSGLWSIVWLVSS